jgi:Flp pilus assembly protein protease CpaA
MAILRFRRCRSPRSNQEWAAAAPWDAGVPYGIALAIAALWVYSDTPFMKSLGM